MKFFTLFTLMLIALVGYTAAQGCIGACNPSCTGGRDVGRQGPLCFARTMWYWNGSSCESMRYLGCGGNNNRYGTKAACEQRCRR